MEPENCYTIGEISKKYRVDDSTVWAHIRKYSIPTRQIGNYVYAPKKEIDSASMSILFFPNFCSIVSGCLAAKLLQFFESPKCFAIYIRTHYFSSLKGSTSYLQKGQLVDLWEG